MVETVLMVSTAYAQTGEVVTEDKCIKIMNVLGETTVTFAYNSDGVEKTYQRDIICTEAPTTMIWDGTTPYTISKYSFDNRHYGVNSEYVYDWRSNRVNKDKYISDGKTVLTEPGFYYFEYRLQDNTIFLSTNVYVYDDDGSPTVEIRPIQSATPSNTDNIPKGITAIPSNSKVLVNGNAVTLTAYEVDGNNYIKLRDFAMAMSETDKQFSTSFDSESKAINLTANKLYEKTGGELTEGAVSEQVASIADTKVYLNGEEKSLMAYNIQGNNYTKLRDVAKLFDIGVTYDNATGTVGTPLLAIQNRTVKYL